MSKGIRWIRTSVAVGLRSQKIGWIFYTHGLARGLSTLGIEAGRQGLAVLGVKSAPQGFDRAFGKNLASAFIELGPTFIKLGQILASRPDMVGEGISEELRVLYDRVPPISFSQIRKILGSELGRHRVRHLIKHVDEKPLASASLSQTHRAELSDGTPVVLKVQKPGVARTVELDLILLEILVVPLSKLYPKMQLHALFKDFKDATLAETDYRREAGNIKRFRANYRKLFSTAEVVFPEVYDELTTQKLLALEPMGGKKLAELKKGSTVARAAASMSLEAILEQIFDHGFFHGDPHGGNLFYLEEEGRLGFIDLGLVGKLDPKDKTKFLKVILSVLKRDRDGLAKNLFDLGEASKATRFDAFNDDIQNLLDESKKKGIQNLRLDEMIQGLLAIARRHGIFIPNRYVMMLRSCLLIEGVVKSLDPNLSIVSVATPVVARSLMKSYSPVRLIKRIVGGP